MKLFASTAAFVLFSAGFSLAALDTQALVADLQAQGYTRIEVKTGFKQVKVEAVRGTEKVETVYDKASGAVLKSETEAVGPGDDTTPGVSYATRGPEFAKGGRRADSSDDSGDAYDDSDGRDDDRGDDRSDDRGDDLGDDRGDDRGGDRSGDDSGDDSTDDSTDD